MTRFHSEAIRNDRVAFLIVLLILTSNLFQFFPGFDPVQETWYVLCLTFLLLPYLFGKASQGWRISEFELYIVLIPVIFPALSALSANSEFGQPILYGLLAQRHLVSVAAVLFILQALDTEFFSVVEVVRALLILGWGCSLLFLAMRLVLNPSDYIDDVGFVTGHGDSASFAFQTHFITFSALYYGFQGLRTGRIINYFFAVGIELGAVGSTGGRSMLLSIFASFFFFMFRWVNSGKLLTVLPKILLGLAILTGAIYLVVPDKFVERAEKFDQAANVVLTGQGNQDESATARIDEAYYGIEGILRRPIFGNGLVSNQWQSGRKGVQGIVFHPSDIGFIGIVYTFGLIGLVYFSMQFLFVYRPLRVLQKGAFTPMLDATKGTLLYFLLVSIVTGAVVWNSSITLFFIVMLRSSALRILSIDNLLAWGALSIQQSKNVS